VELPWLKPFADAWLGREAQDRLPHAVLLSGLPGVGKRAAAVWLARRRLGIGDAGPLPVHPVGVPEHADLRWVRKPEDKQSIGIDQVRELIDHLVLTSYAGGAKVAIIEPADIMTADAANSLLKTLEEPPGDALLMLVADRVGRLPATIFSRCQRINVALPPADASLAWLDRLKPGADWVAALDVAGGAPLAAVGMLEILDETTAMSRDLAAVAERRASPIDVAARWAKQEPHFVLGWLCRQVQQCIYRLSDRGGSAVRSPIPDSVLVRMDRRNLFCYLDTINRLRGQPNGAFNVQLALESLLIDWAQALANYRDSFSPGALLPIPGGR
jgi:DNA polymerase-3 subunit delta'